MCNNQWQKLLLATRRRLRTSDRAGGGFTGRRWRNRPASRRRGRQGRTRTLLHSSLSASSSSFPFPFLLYTSSSSAVMIFCVRVAAGDFLRKERCLLTTTFLKSSQGKKRGQEMRTQQHQKENRKYFSEKRPLSSLFGHPDKPTKEWSSGTHVVISRRRQKNPTAAAFARKTRTRTGGVLVGRTTGAKLERIRRDRNFDDFPR